MKIDRQVSKEYFISYMVDLHWIRFCGYGFMSLIVCLINICICRLWFVSAEKEALFYQVLEYLFLFVVSFSFGLNITVCMSASFSSFFSYFWTQRIILS